MRCRLEGGGGSLGVFPLIDEACRMPRATYQVGGLGAARWAEVAAAAAAAFGEGLACACHTCMSHTAPCPAPPGPPQDLAHTLRTRLAGQPRFGAPRRSQHAFVVDHYAGEVCYSAQHLMDKNKVG